MSETPKADLMAAEFRKPEWADNEYASLALCRLAVADDPEAEADAIWQDIRAAIRKVCDVVGPWAEAWTAWRDQGLAAAETHANRPARGDET